MKRKKAQLQMGENVIMLVIFFFLLVIAVIFFAKIQKSRFTTKTIEFESRSLLDMKTLISTMPELACSENTDVTENCLDIINLGFMENYWESIQYKPESKVREYYRYRFGLSEVSVKMLDPVEGRWTQNWTIYNASNSKFYRLIYVPVSLFDATIDDYSFGLIQIKVFSG